MRFGYLGMLILVVGCTSQEVIHPAGYTQRVYIDSKPTAKSGTIAHFSNRRLGAAYSEDSYLHVLGTRNVVELQDHAPEASFIIDPIENLQKTTLRSYSVYEMSRWERFCGTGPMDKLDWDFIATEGRDNLPETLRVNCTQPTYTRQDYFAAWKASCNEGTPSDAQSRIRNASVSPGKICGT